MGLKIRKDEKEVKERYNFAAEYYHNFRTKENPGGWVYNELLEMPVTLGLLGNVRGKKVLDFGCGSGIYTKLLAKKGAKVKGFDISSGMLEIARKENPKVDLREGSGYDIPFKEKFDIIVASLVLTHIKDWNRVFREINKVLKKKGYFIFSVDNPVSDRTRKYVVNGKKVSYRGMPVRIMEDYFTERKVYGVWKNILKGQKKRNMKMLKYHKTYETIIRTIVQNGFEIVDYKDCFPLDKAKDLFPKQYKFLSNVPCFCVWKVRKK